MPDPVGAAAIGYSPGHPDKALKMPKLKVFPRALPPPVREAVKEATDLPDNSLEAANRWLKEHHKLLMSRDIEEAHAIARRETDLSANDWGSILIRLC